MKNKKILIFGMFVLVVTLLFLVNAKAAGSFMPSASYITSSKGYYTNFNTYYSSEGRLRSYWPILDDPNTCTARQDLLLMIPPGGCQPAVVRSDLLAEQDVPVFCQVEALKLNPLIDIKQISNIGFIQKYPKEVISAGYHPARAALFTHDILMGDPFLGNIGYVVVILRKQPQEEKIPDFVNLNLTARVEYSTGNALGIGRAEFYLSEVSDEEWEQVDRYKQSFWNGKYSVRAERIDTEEMVLSIYSGLQKIGTVTLQRGKESSPIYVPGSFCLASVTANYVDLETAKPKARIEVSSNAGTDAFDVYQGSKFLDDRCSVKSLVVDNAGANTGYVELRCPGKDIKLSILPREAVSLEGDIIPKDVKIKKNQVAKGSSILSIFEGTREVCEVELTQSILGNKAISPGKYSIRREKKDDSWDFYYNTTTNEYKLEDKNLNSDLIALKEELIRKCEGRVLSEKAYDAETEEVFKKAIESYQKVAEEYPYEKESDSNASSFYGAQALEKAIDLTGKYGKTETKVRLMNLYIKLYPDSALSAKYQNDIANEYTFDYNSAYDSVFVNNRYYTIRLIGFETPNPEKVYASFFVRGRNVNLGIGEAESFESSGGVGMIKLKEVNDPEHAEIEVACLDSNDPTKKDLENLKKVSDDRERKKGLASLFLKFVERKYQKLISVKTVKVGEVVSVCDEKITLQNVNLDKVARVRLSPNAGVQGSLGGGIETMTNLSVHIGIEKRAIKLSPDKTLEVIENLNKTIKKWEGINDKLGKIVSGLKGACFATAGVLTVKNFLEGLDGTALARQHAMKGTQYSPGWTKICEDAVNLGVIKRPDGTSESVSYKNINECFSKEASRINEDVKKRAQLLTEVNNQIKNVEKDAVIEGSSFAGGKSIDTTKATAAYLGELQSKCRNGELSERACNIIKDLKKPDEKGNAPYTYADLRELHYQGLLEKNGYVSASNDLGEISKKIKANQDYITSFSGGDKAAENYGLVPATVSREVKNGNPVSGSIGRLKSSGEGIITLNGKEIANRARISLPPESNAAMLVNAGASKYLVVGTEVNNKLEPMAVYKVEEDKGNLSISEEIPGEGDSFARVSKFMKDNKISSFVGKNRAYLNKIRIEDQKVRYFETGPDKGFAAIVPFDVSSGWYAKVRSNIRAGNNIPVYDSSGLPRSWYICNVGENGVIDENDDCQSVFDGISSNEPILGLDPSQSRKLVQQSREALLEANRKYGQRKIVINGALLDVGAPVSSYSGVQCQDFMSPEDCKILFNVCDPVICPATRCDLGGKYPVSDVVQTGIVGSTLLCLPNFPEVYVPVCLTGIHAGLEAYTSILKSYRDCLKENLDNGQLVGICDQITSIYLCEFFWRQVAPVARILLPKLVELAYGKGIRGGGEYLSVMSAWDNMEKSLNYFTQTYAVNSLNVYKIKSLEEAGTPFCKAFVSAQYPTNIRTLLEPESPPQFYAWFSSIKYSDATLPATAQYKVFYHIFAGNNVGIYYRVYLKNPPSSSYYISTPYILVDNGFISKGEYKTETKDFTAPEGYKELCISINGDEQCGFGQVSTDFAVNYLRDQYVNQQANTQGITSEKDCVSGTPSIMPVLANTNPAAAVEEATMPEIYKRGIIRICASQNPGGSIDPKRYVDVGYCDNQKIRCWLDQKSVDNAITDNDLLVKNQTLSEIEKKQMDSLENAGIVLPSEEVVAKIRFYREEINALASRYVSPKQDELSKVKEEISAELLKMNADFGSDLNRVFLNHHKAQILLLRANLNEILANVAYKIIQSKQFPAIGSFIKSTTSGSSGSGGTGGGEISGSGSGEGTTIKNSNSGANQREIYSVNLDDAQEDSSNSRIYFAYNDVSQNWEWSFSYDGKTPWYNVKEIDKYSGNLKPTQKGMSIIKALQSASKDLGKDYLKKEADATIVTPTPGATSGSSGSGGTGGSGTNELKNPKPVFILIPKNKPDNKELFYLYYVSGNELTNIIYYPAKKEFYYQRTFLSLDLLAEDYRLARYDSEKNKIILIPSPNIDISQNILNDLGNNKLVDNFIFGQSVENAAVEGPSKNYNYSLVASSGYTYLFDEKSKKLTNIYINGPDIFYDQIGPDSLIGSVRGNLFDGTIILNPSALKLITLELLNKLNNSKIDRAKVFCRTQNPSKPPAGVSNAKKPNFIFVENELYDYGLDGNGNPVLLNIHLKDNKVLEYSKVVLVGSSQYTPPVTLKEEIGKIEGENLTLYPRAQFTLPQALYLRLRNAKVDGNKIYSRGIYNKIPIGSPFFEIRTFENRMHLYSLRTNEYTPFFIDGGYIYDTTILVKGAYKSIAKVDDEGNISFLEGITAGDLYDTDWYDCLNGATLKDNKIFVKDH